MTARPLQGVTVLEMGTFITGPCTGMMLADLGAEEEPPAGIQGLYRLVLPGRLSSPEATSNTSAIIIGFEHVAFASRLAP